MYYFLQSHDRFENIFSDPNEIHDYVDEVGVHRLLATSMYNIKRFFKINCNEHFIFLMYAISEKIIHILYIYNLI